MRRLLPLLLLAACDAPPQEDRTAFPPDISMRDVTLRQYREGSLALTARTPALGLYRDTGAIDAVDAGVEFVAEGARLDTRRLTGNAFDGVLHASDGVRFQARDGLGAEAPRLTFVRREGARGVASGDAGVVAWRGELRLEAAAFRYDLGEDRAEFERVTTTTAGRTAP